MIGADTALIAIAAVKFDKFTTFSFYGVEFHISKLLPFLPIKRRKKKFKFQFDISHLLMNRSKHIYMG